MDPERVITGQEATSGLICVAFDMYLSHILNRITRGSDYTALKWAVRGILTNSRAHIAQNCTIVGNRCKSWYYQNAKMQIVGQNTGIGVGVAAGFKWSSFTNPSTYPQKALIKRALKHAHTPALDTWTQTQGRMLGVSVPCCPLALGEKKFYIQEKPKCDMPKYF